MKHLKEFTTTAQYEAYTADTANFILPNVSICNDNPTVVYYHPIETRVVAKFNVTDTSSPTKIADNTSGLSAIEIDGVEQLSVVTSYTFSTIGEHTVKYTLTAPTSIGIGAFQNCSGLTSVTIPDSVTSIGERAFQNCSGLTSVTIPDSVTTIGPGAFADCSGLTSVTTPDSVTSIGESAFADCSGLTSVTIPDSVTSIGGRAFQNCSGLTIVTIPDSVTSIGSFSFQNCTSLTTISIPSGVTSISIGTFYQCTNLSSVAIPSGVTSIGAGAFYYCSGLTSITVNAITAPTINDLTLDEVGSSGTLYVPQGSSGYDTWLSKLSGWTKVEQ